MVDGEHYLPVVEAALRGLATEGNEVVVALLAGGREKLPPELPSQLGGAPLVTTNDVRAELDRLLAENELDQVMDLSDEPVLDYRTRHALASIALYHGVGYAGADFTFTPPPRPHLSDRPSIAIIGTGKRTGKTAVAGFAARTLKDAGRKPVVVAMGRGGPETPRVLRGDEVELNAESLIELADSGEHAASDYIEDALLARVPTVGCRRCGGGLAGGVDISNVAAGIAMAAELPGDLMILEGSGSAIPPAHSDATVLVVPASVPDESLLGYMGPYRLLLADCVMVTMCENPFGSPSRVATLTSHIREAFRSMSGQQPKEIEVVRTVFRPTPVSTVSGATVFVATTAPPAVEESMRRHLEEEHGCTVLGFSSALADRARLEQDMKSMATIADTLLVEIKAAGIDVAARAAREAGMNVVFMDNEPHGVDGEDPAALVRHAAELADQRFEGTR